MSRVYNVSRLTIQFRFSPTHVTLWNCRKFSRVLRLILKDYRCDVHQMLLELRDDKEKSWFTLLSPGHVACLDGGALWSELLGHLMSCCCNRKGFMASLNKCLGPLMLRALREDETCQRALCGMLEFDVLESSDMKLQVISTLQSTPSGTALYEDLYERTLNLRVIQQKTGPRKLTLPAQSTVSSSWMLKLYTKCSVCCVKHSNKQCRLLNTQNAYYIHTVPVLRCTVTP